MRSTEFIQDERHDACRVSWRISRQGARPRHGQQIAKHSQNADRFEHEAWRTSYAKGSCNPASHEARALQANGESETSVQKDVV
jgi:hypothetical protein